LILLVRHLDYTNGIAGLSDSHLPAVRALTKIGKPAIPALSDALADPKPSSRGNALLALGEIGGPEATRLLKERGELRKEQQCSILHSQGLGSGWEIDSAFPLVNNLLSNKPSQ
jgi:hypothetical protein